MSELPMNEKIKRMRQLHRRISFFGTPEKGYLDSGLWLYLKYVRTKDEHDALHPVKPLPIDPETGKFKDYILHTFLAFLREEQLCVPKSRQVMVSWLLAIYCTWFARTSKHRLIVWQSKKEDDAAKMVSLGRDDPLGARMSFIEHNLTNPDGTPATWLSDPKILSGKGCMYNRLTYKNGSVIEGVPQGGDQVRSKVPSLFVSDESAFQDEFGKSFEAAQPCVMGGGRALYVSSAAPGYFCDLVNDYEGFDNGDDPPIHQFAENDRLPKGMRFWRSRGGIPVLEIHYTADPDKDPARRGKEWFESASARYGGSDSPGWQQEMEINWKIAGGHPVFPFMAKPDIRARIVVPTVRPEVAKRDMFIFAGFDYGIRNPSVLEVMGVDSKGNLYFLYEWYKTNSTYKEAARAIKSCPYWDVIKHRIVADNSMWALNQQSEGQIKSVAQLFAEEGVRFLKAKRGTPSADVRVATMMKGHYWADPLAPKAFVCMNCRKLIEALRMLRWEEHRSAATAARSDNLEKIVHKWSDPWDAASYGIDIMIRDFKRPPVKLKANTYRAAKREMERHEQRLRWSAHYVGA